MSESDSSDSEPETPLSKTHTDETDNLQVYHREEISEEKIEMMEQEESPDLNLTNQEIEEKTVPASMDDLDSSNSVIQNIWDNFKTYQANKEKMDNLLLEPDKTWEEIGEEVPVELSVAQDPATVLAVVLMDHDYCINLEEKADTSIIEVIF